MSERMTAEELAKVLFDGLSCGIWDGEFVVPPLPLDEVKARVFALIEADRRETERLCAERQDGAGAILRERERQKTIEGWTPEHDDEHYFGELAEAAVAYALGRADLFPKSWNLCWWKTPRKPNGEIDRKRELEKAGALIAAEWDRLDRLENSAITSPAKEDSHE